MKINTLRQIFYQKKVKNHKPFTLYKKARGCLFETASLHEHNIGIDNQSLNDNFAGYI